MCEANGPKQARCVVTYACPESFTADDMSQLESEIDALKRELIQLKYQKRQQNEEFDILNWYTAVMEDGKCTKELWKELE